MPLPTYSESQAVYQLTNGYWGGSRHFWTLDASRTITYSLSPTISAAEKSLIEAALKVWSEVADIHFLQSTSGQIYFNNNAAGAFTSSSYMGSSLISASVNVSTSRIASYGNSIGSYSFQTYIHEIGHALGLGHTGNYNSSAIFAIDALYANDSWQTSVMSYFSQAENTYLTASYAYVLTPMAFDIAAIRALYGAAIDAHGGNTTYGLGTTAGDSLDYLGTANFNPAVAFTLVDASGSDLIDFTPRSEANRINLAAGAVSDVFGKTGNMIIDKDTVIENLRTGLGADTIVGNAVANVISSGAGNDSVDGGAGDDTLTGGSGNDTLAGGVGSDTFVFAMGFGQDRIADFTAIDFIDISAIASMNSWDSLLVMMSQSAFGVSITNFEGTILLAGVTQSALNAANFLFAHGGGVVTGLTLVGTAEADNLIGGMGNDTINGLAANDIIAAGAGSDSISGGVGNDTINAGDGDDRITFTGALDGFDSIDGGLGNDRIEALANNTVIGLASVTGVETISGGVFTGVVLRGSTLANTLDFSGVALDGVSLIDGGAGNDSIVGSVGNDVIVGGTGVDTLVGGLGDDTYVTDGGDTITETLNAGTDEVQSSVAYTLGANLENLTLTGAAAINGTGNALNNRITGTAAANVLKGDTGADTLNGGTGVDTLIGGLGNDTYVTDGGDTITEALNAGTDEVQSSVAYTLGANLENLTLTGAAAINGTGNALNNRITGNAAANTLVGGTGVDTLVGGAGNDTYVTDGGDILTEAAGEGTDLVQSATSYTLGANLENLALTGAAAITGTGNELGNQITGNTAANFLNGLAGNDTLNGGTGVDTLAGGLGDDTYLIDGGDTITEAASAGIDLVLSSVTYTLAANLERLTLSGAAAINGIGNAADNVITGNAAANVLNGGTGVDTLFGGAGNDTYVTDGGDTITEALGAGIDLVQSSASLTLGANLENLTLTGAAAIDGTGNALGNLITGNAAANVLDGAGGTDTLVGGLGNDTYVTDGGDTITEAAGAGTDLVLSSATTYTLGANLESLTLTGAAAINGIGNALANVITGNGAANVLNGGTGVDTLIGGQGDDTYVTDGGDTINEAAGAGIDLVQSSVAYTLGTNLENLTLTGAAAINGTGNAADNVITGNAAANVLNGGTGVDTLVGGAGNDIYVTDGDEVLTEGLRAGTDLVQSSASLTLGANFENLTLTGAAAIDGTGNALANLITGNAANNVLNGAGGADTLVGGLGNDTYVTDGGDTITEAAGAGTDLVLSSVTYTVGANLENLTLTGAAAINGTGNALNNLITGNAAANVLNGGTGVDTLVGGAGNDTLNGGAGNDYMEGGYGNDTFIFNTPLGVGQVDQVADFSVVDDAIWLENAIFTGLANGVLAATAFVANATGLAEDASDRIIYQTDTGDLFFDADGNGAGSRVLIAVLDPGLAVTNADFFAF